MEEVQTQEPVAPKPTWQPWIILAVISIVLVIAGFFIGRRLFTKTPTISYDAVFLTNGQVYFGQFQPKQPYAHLSNIYYLQQTQASTSPGISLVKLGQELHGPTDEMFINTQQILFYEHLRDDSQVVQAIKNFKK